MNYIKISKEYFLNCKFPSRQLSHKKAVMFRSGIIIGSAGDNTIMNIN